MYMRTLHRVASRNAATEGSKFGFPYCADLLPAPNGSSLDQRMRVPPSLPAPQALPKSVNP